MSKLEKRQQDGTPPDDVMLHRLAYSPTIPIPIHHEAVANRFEKSLWKAARDATIATAVLSGGFAFAGMKIPRVGALPMPAKAALVISRNILALSLFS